MQGERAKVVVEGLALGLGAPPIPDHATKEGSGAQKGKKNPPAHNKKIKEHHTQKKKTKERC